MIREILFDTVILLANIIQGITGFAGTILAIPFSLELVGYSVAVPILNMLGLLSGIYVYEENRSSLNRHEVRRVVEWMLPSLIIGILVRNCCKGHEKILYVTLGMIVLAIACHGLFFQKELIHDHRWMLVSAGVVHGMFVCGGPLLTGYLAEEVHDQKEFRTTISFIWVILNGILVFTQIMQGMWSLRLLKIQCITLPFLLAGMMIGSRIADCMSRERFMKLTYVLLLIAGISLLLK